MVVVVVLLLLLLLLLLMLLLMCLFPFCLCVMLSVKGRRRFGIRLQGLTEPNARRRAAQTLYTWGLTRAVRYVFLCVVNGCTIQRRTYCVNSLCLSSAITVRQIQIQAALALRT